MRAKNRGSRGATRTGWQQRRPEVEVDENLILQTALTSPRERRLVTEQVRAACEEERTCRAVAIHQNRESGSQSGTCHASSFVLVCYQLPPPSSIYAVRLVGQSHRQGTTRAHNLAPNCITQQSYFENLDLVQFRQFCTNFKSLLFVGLTQYVAFS